MNSVYLSLKIILKAEVMARVFNKAFAEVFNNRNKFPRLDECKHIVDRAPTRVGVGSAVPWDGDDTKRRAGGPGGLEGRVPN